MTQLTKSEHDKIVNCVAGRLIDCSVETGIHYATIKHIVLTGNATHSQIVKLLEFCDKIESEN